MESEGLSNGLIKVDFGSLFSWYEARDRAKKMGGRLPTTAELRTANVDAIHEDKWTPITPSSDDKQTGRRDGMREDGENAWANIGPRKYQTEYPEWGLDMRDRGTLERHVGQSFYVQGGHPDFYKVVPAKFGIFEVEHFHLVGGDIKQSSTKTQDEARELAIKTLKEDDDCMKYRPSLNECVHQDISRCNRVEKSISNDVGNGETTAIDQNGLLYALGTTFGTRSWENPFLSGDVGVNLSKGSDNYYTDTTGIKAHEVKEASSVIVDNKHRGSCATMWSGPGSSESPSASKSSGKNEPKSSPDSEVE